MNSPASSPLHRPLHRWLLGLALLCLGVAASAQQDPPGRVARLSLQQGTVSFSPAGEESWYDAQPNRPLTTGDRLWADRNARAEIHIGSAALRLDGQTHVEFSELDDDTVRLTSNQGNLQLRVRDDLAGQRVEVDTGNLAVVIDAPGEYRIAADPAAGTTWIAVASGHVTLYGENGESQSLDARQQLTVSGRNLVAVAGAPSQAVSFDAWVAERNRIEDQSVSARYVSREVVGYQQLDNYGDWQNDATYGDVWFPRNVDADWAPYRDGQWVNVAPWGLTWVDAAPWGFAPFHYGRWVRVGPRWAWVPGRPQARPVYSPALVGFVGGSGGANASFQIGSGRNGVGWFPLAPGEPWRPGYSASQRYLDQVNRMALRNRQANDFYANQQMPGAVTVLPADRFGRGPFNRRDLVRLPDDRFARVPVMPTPGIAISGSGGGFGRPAAAPPPAAALIGRQQQMQFQQAQQLQLMQQRAAQAQAAQQQQHQQMEWQRQQGARQQQEPRQQQEWQQQQRLQRQQQQQEALRQQQEMQQRAAQAQAQQQQVQMQQQRAAQQAQAQQQLLRQQQEAQQRAAQVQQTQAQQQNAMRQAQEAQVRAMQQQRGFAPPAQPAQPQQGPRGDDNRRLWTTPDQR